MKLRVQLQVVSVFIILTMLGVITAEALLWINDKKKTEVRNYVTLCLKDVFELNLLTHELNLFWNTDRPIDQMELKMAVLTERFQNIAVRQIFSTSEIEAVKSTLQAIRGLLLTRRETSSRMALLSGNLNKEEIYEREGALLLQKAQTLYGAFSLMKESLSEQESEEEHLNSFIRGVLVLIICGAVGFPFFFLYRHVVQSFALLEAGASEVASGNMNFKFPLTTTQPLDEIGAVKKTFNGMVSSLQEALGEIQKKNKELETLLYVVSHDLKEPLRSVEYFSKIVSERYAAVLEPEARDYLNRSFQGAVRLRSLLDDILVLSKARSVLVPDAVVAAKEIIQKVLERLDHKIKETGAKITVADDFPDLRVEPLWAQEALLNLVGNALKYTRQGEKPQIEILPYFSETSPPKETGFVVQDRGPGVKPEFGERIFLLFQRGVGREIEGTGAGLAIVKTVAERHGGRAWVEPREGGGSKFIITFKV